MSDRGWRPATPAEAVAPITRLGGRPCWSGAPRWPAHRGEPLEFVGQFAVQERLVLVFMSYAEDAESWPAEGGANAALVEPDGAVPEWVSVTADPDGPVALGTEVLVPAGWTPGTHPVWVQYDQTPAAAPIFVAQLASFPDERGMITFGDGGVAYVFRSADWSRARLLWQTS
ncbi:hypothetical protein ACN28C_10590 [Plantactinospora sp. WMMC1484]|uniref:hypothetical protein n=1 Tax=Plantactinospora sp. WMMC1484 TaxID=3404122 RepID=UPI003BF4F255